MSFEMDSYVQLRHLPEDEIPPPPPRPGGGGGGRKRRDLARLPGDLASLQNRYALEKVA
jgi:hypothetical protein